MGAVERSLILPRTDITPGDVYIAEGEEPETLRISAADARTRVEAIEIASADGSPLRWVP